MNFDPKKYLGQILKGEDLQCVFNSNIKKPQQHYGKCDLVLLFWKYIPFTLYRWTDFLFCHSKIIPENT